MRLRGKLGPLLWQFPPTLRYDRGLLDAFFTALPNDTEQARDFARRREPARMRGRTALAIDRKRRIRHAVEVRHDSFRDESFIALLRRRGIALVVADSAGRWPCVEDVTAGFVYLRPHGNAELYVSGYGDAALDDWAGRIRAWADGGEPRDARKISARAPRPRRSREVYCYFDNDADVRAPFDARALIAKLQSPGT